MVNSYPGPPGTRLQRIDIHFRGDIAEINIFQVGRAGDKPIPRLLLLQDPDIQVAGLELRGNDRVPDPVLLNSVLRDHLAVDLSFQLRNGVIRFSAIQYLSHTYNRKP